jgi:hypothetical protein
VKGLSGKLILLRFKFFFPHLGDIKWRHAKVSHFCDFFKLVTPDSEPVWTWQRTKLAHMTRRCGVPL